MPVPDLKPWDDIRFTARGPDIWNRKDDVQMAMMGIEEFRKREAAAEGQLERLICPMGFGRVARWYWVWVALFMVGCFWGVGLWQAVAMGAAVAAVAFGVVLFGGTIERALAPVWPYLKWGLIAAGALLILHTFVSSALSAAGLERGLASVYSVRSSGATTASGQKLNDGAMTAAHRTLPFGTKVKVTHAKTGKSVVVTITDRGPFVRGRVIDLTIAAANALGMGWGLAPVILERVS